MVLRTLACLSGGAPDACCEVERLSCDDDICPGVIDLLCKDEEYLFFFSDLGNQLRHLSFKYVPGM